MKIITSTIAVCMLSVAPLCFAQNISSLNHTPSVLCNEDNSCMNSLFTQFEGIAHHGGNGYTSQFSTFSTSGPSKRRATGNNVFVFDPNKLRWYAYDRYGNLVNSGAASGGKHYCPDVKRRCKTPVGKFKVHRKGSVYCKSTKYPLGRGGAPMPYCMFFHGGYAIHGSPDVPNYNASHGCIRVRPHMARWLHRNFINIGTTVVVRPY